MALYGGNFRVLVAASEGATPGTATDLATTDVVVRVRGAADEITVTPNHPFDNENSKHATGDHGKDQSLVLESTANIDFSVRWSASDAYGTDPSTEPAHYGFAKACGLATQDYTTTGVGLQDRMSADEATLSIWVVDIQGGAASPTGVAMKFKGCIGDMTLSAENSPAPIMASYAFQGVFTDEVDLANGALPAYVGTAVEDALAHMWTNYACTVHSDTLNISAWSLTTGNSIEMVRDQSSDTGVSHFAIVDKNPRLQINPLRVAVATEDPYAVITGNAVAPITFLQGAGSSVAKFKLYFPNTQLISNGQALREGLRGFDRTYKLLRNEMPGAAAIYSHMADESMFNIVQGAVA